jgi:hypothetical protein
MNLHHESLTSVLPDLPHFRKKIPENSGFSNSASGNTEYNCYHCINNYSSFTQISKLLENQQKNQYILQEFKYIRCLYNVLNITNLIVVFFIYGGPKTINIFFLITSFLLFASIYIESQQRLLLLDSFIFVLSIIVMIKSVHTLILRCEEISKKIERKES